MDGSPEDLVALWHWRRAISELYVSIRRDDPKAAWDRWCETRRRLFTTHPQSPIPETERPHYAGPFVFPYDHTARVTASLASPDPAVPVPTTSGDGHLIPMVPAARAVFELFGSETTLDIYWLDQYGGGMYLAFRDVTSGSSTYGGGRYLLDTTKGADLGGEDGHVVLDFNFAYQPSCSYDPRWVCPLPPPQNDLAVEVRAGERLTDP